MTLLKRWARRWLARLLDRWEEGPEAPVRLAEEVRLFRHRYPAATPAEWERFAQRHGDSCYRTAFVRGFEWNERCWPDRDVDPDAVAAFYQNALSIGESDPRVRRLLAEPPAVLTPEQTRLIEELAASPYRIRIEFKE